MNVYYELKDIKNLTNFSEDDQKRIKYLRIPPNWNSIKISKDPSSKIQVTGKDSKGRTQYIYHPAWIEFSKETKYSKLNSINFNKFETTIKRYSKFKGIYSKNYIISNMFIIMKDLNIRVGNEKYLEENDSVGLCTLNKLHYKKIKENLSDSKIIYKLIFKGKKGVIHEKILLPKHVNFIENIIYLPGKSLFKYSNESNESKYSNESNKSNESNESKYSNESNESNKSNENKKEIDNKIYKKIVADDLNQFLKEHIDKNMSCKDIRTYCANKIFKKQYTKFIKNGLSFKKAKIEAIKLTAYELGNTPKVCRDSYIDPMIYNS
jgi:DNA topoisomerase-1